MKKKDRKTNNNKIVLKSEKKMLGKVGQVEKRKI